MLKQEIKIGRTGVQNFRTGETFGFINPDDFEIIEQIGQGSCGAIYKALHVPTSTIVAIKSINIYDSDKRHQLANELLALNQ